MALYLIIALAAIACFFTFLNWRHGIFWMIVLAAVQDPIRKLIPNAPNSLLLISIPVFFISLFTMLGRYGNSWSVLAGFYPRIVASLRWLILACIPAAILSFLYGPGSWTYTLFGALSYSYIPLAILLGFCFLRSEKDLRLLLIFYCVISSVLLLGTFIEYFNLSFLPSIVGTKALGFDWIRYRSGYTVDLLAGFYRSPDVMGWHAASTSMLTLLLAFSRRGNVQWQWLMASGLAFAALLVSGRRKMTFMVPFFVLLFVFLLSQSRRRGLNFQSLLILSSCFLITYVTADLLGLNAESEVIRYYTDDPGDISTQVQTHAWASVWESFRQNGFWGAGLGFASPGAQNLPFPRPRMWQESGPSRLVAEVGLPGLTMMVVFLGQVVLSAWRNIQSLASRFSIFTLYSIGLLAFVIANIGSLSVSGQILADPFISCFIGFSMGMQLSLLRLSIYSGEDQDPRIASAPAAMLMPVPH